MALALGCVCECGWSEEHPFSHHPEVLNSEMAVAALAMGLDPVTVETTILDKLRRTGADYPSAEALIQDCFSSTPATTGTTSEGVCCQQ